MDGGLLVRNKNPSDGSTGYSSTDTDALEHDRIRTYAASGSAARGFQKSVATEEHAACRDRLHPKRPNRVESSRSCARLTSVQQSHGPSTRASQSGKRALALGVCTCPRACAVCSSVQCIQKAGADLGTIAHPAHTLALCDHTHALEHVERASTPHLVLDSMHDTALSIVRTGTQKKPPASTSTFGLT